MGLGHSPRIVTDGMVLCLDAANPKNFNLTEVEVLVVAGGGAGGGYGGNDGAGGGGAGGLIYNRNFSVTPGSAVNVTVGAGGAGVGGAVRGNSGGNSVFGALTAIGGGGGGSEGAAEQRPGGSGGSGGGGGGYGVGGTGGNGTAGQGNKGGDCTAPGDGGGGGAGSAGENGLTGKGGLGLGFDISGSFVYYAGGGGASGDKRNARGGGGAIGGIGGGGKGQDATNSTPPENGSPNTGGGGGAAAGSNPTYGAGTTLTSGAGGSGIVIVRYPGPQKAIGGTVTSVAGHTIHTFTTVGSTTFTPLVATNNSAISGLSDLSGNGNFGTTQNSPTYSSANGGSINCASNTIITVPMINLRPTTAITQECWFLTTNNVAQVFIGSQYGSDSNNSYALWLNTTNQWAAGVNIGGSFNYQTYNSTVSTNVWYHYVHTYDGANQRMYINGSQVHSWATTGLITYDTNNTLLAVGNDWNSGYNGGASIGVQGKISSVKIYNRALTSAEISQNFNALRGRYGI